MQIICIWSSWCHCHPQTPSFLALFKSTLVLPFWFQLTQVVLEKRPLNGCSIVVLLKHRLEVFTVIKQMHFYNCMAVFIFKLHHMNSIGLDVACCYTFCTFCVFLCLSVCWAHWWLSCAKWLNCSKFHLGRQTRVLKEPYITLGKCTLAPPGEYDCMIRTWTLFSQAVPDLTVVDADISDYLCRASSESNTASQRSCGFVLRQLSSLRRQRVCNGHLECHAFFTSTTTQSVTCFFTTVNRPNFSTFLK